MDLVSFVLDQHAGVHFGDVGGRESYADRVLRGLTESQMCARPVKGVNSIVWLLWHMARTEDASVNLVVTNGRQVLDDDWAKRMNIPSRIIGTGMTDAEVDELSARADVAAVLAYRKAVGLRTREVVKGMRPQAWDEPVEIADTSRAAAAGAFGPKMGWRDDVGYKGWQDQSRAERLNGGAIRHNALHLGEAITVRGLAGLGLGI
jgi:hypothetical protein